MGGVADRFCAVAWRSGLLSLLLAPKAGGLAVVAAESGGEGVGRCHRKILPYRQYATSLDKTRTKLIWGGRHAIGMREEHITASQADRRAALEAVAARLARVAEQQDLALVLEAEAAQEARGLTELIRDDQADIHSRYLLGWLYWYRYQALPDGQGQSELDSAISMFIPCLLGDIELQNLPEPLLPILADRIIPTARALYEKAQISADLRLISYAVDIWIRLVTATPGDHARRAERLSELGSTLRIRFERTGAQADLDKAIDMARQAAAATPSGHPDRAAVLSGLGTSLLTRFGQTGAQADLDDAIQVGRSTAQSRPQRPRRPPRHSITMGLPHPRRRLKYAHAERQEPVARLRAWVERIYRPGYGHFAATRPGRPAPGGDLQLRPRAARAFRRAVRCAREHLPRTPSLWAGYLHVGA